MVSPKQSLGGTDGNPARWGLHQTTDRLWIQPFPLMDALTHEGFAILDAIFEHTPLEALMALNDGLDTQADEIDYYEPDAVERSSRQALGEMLETRGSDIYLWHLGMHPDQFT